MSKVIVAESSEDYRDRADHARNLALATTDHATAQFLNELVEDLEETAEYIDRTQAALNDGPPASGAATAGAIA